jgi:hypothetical protein
MKKIVIELLQQRQLEQIFNETDFNYYRRKITKGKSDVNQYMAALTIMDLFILNSLPSVSA